MSSPFGSGAVLLTRWCNIFGAETGGREHMLGGLASQKPSRQWYCPTPSIGRYRMVCEHGHKGQVMDLCASHWKQFKDSVTFCPKCNAEPPGHKCTLRLEGIS